MERRRGLATGAASVRCARVFPSAEQTAETIDLVLRLYEEWAEKGLRPGELDFVKSYLQKSHAFTVQTADDRLNLRTRLQVCDMPEDDEKTYPDRVARVSEADIQRAMASFLHPDDLLITLVATADTVLPSLQKLPGLRNAEFEVVPHNSFWRQAMSDREEEAAATARVRAACAEVGLSIVGITQALALPDHELYLAWLAAGYAGELAYLHRDAADRADVRNLLPQARSVLTVALSYHFPFDEEVKPESQQIAHFVRGTDYRGAQSAVARPCVSPCVRFF
ncbi:MAG: QueG-associated DUF1730 domain-containing protein [Polyangia bacterium]